MLTCPHMPYDGWICRVRVTQHEVNTDNFPCKHCGTKFSTPKAAGRRSVECARRRTRQHLPLNLQQWHDALNLVFLIFSLLVALHVWASAS